MALHLLTEKEKKDLVQLVSTMVSYSITYRSIKSNPVSSNPRHEVPLDAPVLTFDPPLGDLIHFKVSVLVSLVILKLCFISLLIFSHLFNQDYRSSHHVLTLAMKQVLLHEVSDANM